MVSVYGKLYSLLDASERRNGFLVFLLLALVAFVDVLGVASILPFIAVLANPDVVTSNRYLAMAYAALGFTSRDTFLFALGLAFFAVLVGSLSLQAVGIWAQFKFSHNRNCVWSAKLVRGYLRQPYEWFLNRHSATLATAVLAEVNQVVTGALLPAIQAIAHVLVALFLMVLLVIVDPGLALTVGVILSGGYGLISIGLRRRLRRIGLERRLANRSRYLVVQEALGGIKDVKISGLEESFVRRFLRPARTLASRQISANLMSQLPSFAIQALLFGGMLLTLLYLMANYGGFQEALPVAALYAFAGYRLMPAVQAIYRDISQLRFSEAAVDSLCSDFASLQTEAPRERPASGSTGEARLKLEHAIELRNVSYAYPNAARSALSELCLTIPALSTIGVVGATGSGKTTLVDLVLGLLRPREGSILADGVEITDECVREWQRSLGYVPQQIFLADDTVAGNIAFGLPSKEIDLTAVERAARIANLHDFVTGELPEGYQTTVGERGVRLSGGQRQRIGIARALYHDPDVLILDEATSALDNLTEHAVMEAVHNLSSRKTIVIIAHRLTTVRGCDCIYLLEQGRLIGSGPYEALFARSERFRAMAGIV